MRQKDRTVMLLSLKPSFAAMIYRGTKTIELRRVKPSRRFAKVLIYETSPVKRITGCFTVRWIKSFSPSRAWARFRARLGVTRRAYRAYFEDCRAAILLAVSRVRRFSSPIELSTWGTRISAPRSYRYIDSGVLLGKLPIGRAYKPAPD